MGILGKKNRTENWQTGKHFCPLNDEAKIKLVQKLLEPYNKDLGLEQNEKVKLELFWFGTRDYLFEPGKKEIQSNLAARYQEKFAECYRELFCDLHDQAEMVGKGKLKLRAFENLEHWQYAAPKEDELKKKLFNNLFHTEIDIVLVTSKYLFIGEAKHESSLNNNPGYVLPHQLVRQYVMARVLLRFIKESLDVKERTVVPFVVGDSPDNLRNSHQVKFMVEIKKLKEDNVLSWKYIEDLVKSHKAE